MRIAIVGLPGSGKTSLYNALTETPVDVLPGVPGAAPHVSVLKVRDERLEWLRDLYQPKKYTPAALTIEDHPGIPAGAAKSDRRGELFAGMRNADGLVVVVRACKDAYTGADPDPAHDLELIALEFVSADLDICERRLARLESEWKKPASRDRVEKEQAVVRRLAEALNEGQGAHAVAVRRDEEAFIKGFQLLTSKPVLLVVNTTEEGEALALASDSLPVKHTFATCAQLEADLATMDPEDSAVFAKEYGITEALRDRFNLACYRALGLRSFFTVGEDEVRAWTILAGDDAVTAAGKIHSDLARGFIRAEVIPYSDLREFGSEREVKAKGKQRLEGKDYTVMDGDILNIRFSV